MTETNKDLNSRGQKERFNVAAQELLIREKAANQAVVAEIHVFACLDNYGHIPGDKPDDCWRLMFENWNSLGAFTGQKKVNIVNRLIKQYDVDTVAKCEAKYDWKFVEKDSQFKELFAFGKK